MHLTRIESSQKGFTFFEILIAISIVAIGSMAAVQISTMIDAIKQSSFSRSEYQSFKTELAGILRSSSKCKKAFGTTTVAVSPVSNTTVNVYRQDGVTLWLKGSSPSSTQGLFGTNDKGGQVLSVTVEPVTSTEGTVKSETYIFAQLKLTYKLSGVAGTSVYTDYFPITFRVATSTNDILACASETPDAVGSVKLPHCEPGQQLIYKSANASVAPQWQCEDL